MRLATNLQVLTLSSLFVFGAAAHADVVHDESTNGDLSNSPGAPTPVEMFLGNNIVTGTCANPTDARDYMTFRVPAGMILTELRMQVYEDALTSGPGNTGYHCLAAGDTSFIPNMTTADDFLGGDHLFTLPPGTDLLPSLAAAAANGTGFALPLGPGIYTWEVQQTGPELTGYRFNFVLSASGAPVPASGPMTLAVLAALLLGAGWMLLRRRAPAV